MLIWERKLRLNDSQTVPHTEEKPRSLIVARSAQLTETETDLWVQHQNREPSTLSPTTIKLLIHFLRKLLSEENWRAGGGNTVGPEPLIINPQLNEATCNYSSAPERLRRRSHGLMLTVFTLSSVPNTAGLERKRPQTPPVFQRDEVMKHLVSL